MEEHYETQRRTRRKKRKPRKLRIAITLLLLLIIASIIYIVIQYNSGLKMAKKEDDSSITVDSFEGDEETGNVVNYLLLGIDTREGEISRTDSMMVLSRNKTTGDYKLVSFMRDIYAEIPGYQNYKLNTAFYLGLKESIEEKGEKDYGEGINLLKDTLKQMFDIPIHHYAIVDFKSFETLVDIVAPEGVEIDVEKDMSANIGVSLKAGKQKLNGKELLGYARFRKDAEGDFGRVRRQQQVINAVKAEVLTPSNIPSLPKLAGAIQGYVKTDLTTKDEVKLAASIIKSGTSELERLTIPIEGAYHFASYRGKGSVIEIDKEENKKALHEFLGMDE